MNRPDEPFDAHFAQVTASERQRYLFSATIGLYEWHRIDQKLHGSQRPLALPPDTVSCPLCAHAAKGVAS